jgi:hypothetical protein
MFELMTGMMVFCALIAAVALVIWIWALVDAIRNPALDHNMRLMWVLVIIFTSVIGAIIYLVMARSTGAKRV